MPKQGAPVLLHALQHHLNKDVGKLFKKPHCKVHQQSWSNHDYLRAVNNHSALRNKRLSSPPFFLHGRVSQQDYNRKPTRFERCTRPKARQTLLRKLFGQAYHLPPPTPTLRTLSEVHLATLATPRSLSKTDKMTKQLQPRFDCSSFAHLNAYRNAP